MNMQFNTWNCKNWLQPKPILTVCLRKSLLANVTLHRLGVRMGGLQTIL